MMREFGLFNVPLFFMVSGFFLSKRKDTRTFITEKFHQLIIPYFLTSVGMLLVLIVKLLFADTTFIEAKTVFMRRVLALVYGSGSPYECEAFSVDACGPIWFLLSLFVGFAIVRVCINYKWGFIPIILCMVTGYVTSRFVWMPFELQAGMVDVGYIYIGYLLKYFSSKVKDKLEEKPNKAVTVIEYVIEVIVMLVSFAAIWLYCKKYTTVVLISNNSFENGFVDFGMTILASFGVLIFCKLILDHIPGIKQGLMYIGKNTLLILCFHTIDTVLFGWRFIFDRYEEVTIEPVLLVYVLKIILYIVLVVLWNSGKKLINNHLLKQEKVN